MYVMWTVTLVLILVATFTNFAYLDLNVLAIVFLGFTAVNTFFVVSSGKRRTPNNDEPTA